MADKLRDISLDVLGSPLSRLSPPAPSPANVAVAYNYPATWRDPSTFTKANAEFEDPLYRALDEAKDQITMTLIHYPPKTFWRRLLNAKAKRIVVLVNPFEKFFRQEDPELIAALIKRAEIYTVRNSKREGYLHFRGFLLDDKCALSESSFSTMGSRYSDQMMMMSADKEVCRPLREALANILRVDEIPFFRHFSLFNKIRMWEPFEFKVTRLTGNAWSEVSDEERDEIARKAGL